VAEHEIAHSYFPFYMGINETRYGFMDEGWATTFEFLIGTADMGGEKAKEFYKEFRINYYTYDPSSTEDLPIITPGDELTGASLGTNEYGKPSLAYLAVKDMLGDELFKKCLHTYMDRWHGKHPIPWDFFYSFNDAAGQDLNWFWSNWFFSNNYLDIAVGSVSQSAAQMKGGSGSKNVNVDVRNVGGLDMPFDVVLHYTDGSSKTAHQTPAVWKSNQQLSKIAVPIDAGKTLASLELNTGIFVDADSSNNKWTAQ
jgi:hypothetical protein